MTKAEKKRIVLGKLGLDCHDNGIHIVAKWLSDAGFEVIYAGLFNTPESLIQTALQEEVDAIGCSFLGGEHLYYTRELTELMRKKHMSRVKVILGGVIPQHDLDELKKLGVSHIFSPGTMRDALVNGLNHLFMES